MFTAIGLVFILVLVIIIVSYFLRLSRHIRGVSIIERGKSIRFGMTAKQVMDIMGLPPNKTDFNSIENTVRYGWTQSLYNSVSSYHRAVQELRAVYVTLKNDSVVNIDINDRDRWY